MKTIALTLALCVCGYLTSHAQTEGIVTYKQTIKFELELDGMNEEMKSMLPESQSIQKVLLFNTKESVYQNKKGESMEDLDLKSDDGSFHIKLMVDDTEDIYYKSFTDNSKVHQRGMMGKSFVVKDKLPKHKWKITAEKIRFLDYECQKAIIEDGDRFIVAWFTSEVPVMAGPAGLHGLPGLILMANYNDGETQIQAESVEFTKLNSGDIKVPNDGKKVSEEEFTRIQKEKEKEMEEMYGEGNVIRERR